MRIICQLPGQLYLDAFKDWLSALLFGSGGAATCAPDRATIGITGHPASFRVSFDPTDTVEEQLKWLVNETDRLQREQVEFYNALSKENMTINRRLNRLGEKLNERVTSVEDNLNQLVLTPIKTQASGLLLAVYGLVVATIF